MSGKYRKKKKGQGAIIALIAVLAVAAVLIAALLSDEDTTDQQTEPSTDATQVQTEATEASGTEPTDVPMNIPGIQLGRGLVITEIGAYSGAYVEDGTDEQVSDVLMLVVANAGDADIQYAEITLSAGDEQAVFTLSTLPVGEYMVVLEQNRMTYDEDTAYDQAEARNVALFSDQLSLCQDRIRIQSLDGAVNISNLSGADIAGDVVIYYKNIADGMLMGGITYRVRLTGGMAAGEIRQIMSEHYSASGSRVMFVTCG